MAKSKASRRLRPVRTASGQIREEVEVIERRPWLWGGIVWLLVLVLSAAGAVQWREGLIRDLPHVRRTAAALELPVQPAASPIATTSPAAPIDEAAVTAALGPLLKPKGPLGPHVDVLVTGLTGDATYVHGSDPITPASTLKLLTALAALQLLSPQARFTTSVQLTGPSTLTLVGGGDPYLVTEAPREVVYPRRATLTDLARATATYLAKHQMRAVRLAYDAGLFSGPGLSAAWERTYFAAGVIAPISALWTDEDRLPNGMLAHDPAAHAAAVFARLLRDRGIMVLGMPAPATVTATSIPVAQVTSAPLADVLWEILATSDNFAAEVLARHIAIAAGQPPTFNGAVEGIERTLSGLGIPLAGLVMHDGSGLSRRDRLEPATLAAILRKAASTPRFASLLTDLPVAGFDGSLGYRFVTTSPTALGSVRAKTGTLTGVHSMAGIALDASGVPLVFVLLADRVAKPKTLDARDLLDHLAAALTQCRCSVAAP